MEQGFRAPIIRSLLPGTSAWCIPLPCLPCESMVCVHLIPRKLREHA